MPADKEKFQDLTLIGKYQLVKNEGEFIASRLFQGYHIHLFLMNGFYVELWQRVGLKQIYWIEVVNSQKTLEEYLDNLDIDFPVE